MGRMGPGSMGQWVMGLGYDGSDGSWVTNGDPWSTLPVISRTQARYSHPGVRLVFTVCTAKVGEVSS